MNPQISPTSISRLRHWSLRPDRHITLSMGSWSSPPPYQPTTDAGPATPTQVGFAAGPAGVRGGQRGMTLVEILIVVVLVGMAALISVTNLQTVQKRFQLENEVRELTAFLQTVPNYARQTNGSVFLVWDPTARSFKIATDSTATDPNTLDTMVIRQELTITGPAAPVLRCDIVGRTFVGTSATMMTTVQTVSITHAYTPEASAPSYIFSLSPLWGVEVTQS